MKENRMDLNSAELFARVVQKGSFSAASKLTGVPVATVSRRVSELETALGVRLLERSTRTLRLTGAGTTLYDYISRGVQEMEAGLLALQDREAELRGTLRLSLPPNFEPWWPLLHAFQAKFSNIDIDIYATERKIDLIEDGVDIALRVGDKVQMTAIVRPILSYRHILVASPAFIKLFGEPKSVSDIHALPCAAWAKKGGNVIWNLGGEDHEVKPFIRSNDYPHMRYLAEQGLCITEQPPFLVRTQLRSGALVQVLRASDMPELDVSLLYPSRKQLSRIARVYIDFCIDYGRRHWQESGEFWV